MKYKPYQLFGYVHGELETPFFVDVANKNDQHVRKDPQRYFAML